MERLWRDVIQQCSAQFCNIDCFIMEDMGLHNVNDELHMFSVHVFLNRINSSL